MGLIGLKIGWDKAKAFLLKLCCQVHRWTLYKVAAMATTMSAVVFVILAFFVFNSSNDKIC
jgi:hypothetical protein